MFSIKFHEIKGYCSILVRKYETFCCPLSPFVQPFMQSFQNSLMLTYFKKHLCFFFLRNLSPVAQEKERSICFVYFFPTLILWKIKYDWKKGTSNHVFQIQALNIMKLWKSYRRHKIFHPVSCVPLKVPPLNSVKRWTGDNKSNRAFLILKQIN